MRAAWTRFAAGGDPGWPAYDSERRLAQVYHAQPKVVPYPEETSRLVWVGGAGAVGTGSIRGMPVLHELSEAGFTVWPFEPAGDATIIEIYPRLFTGKVVKRSAVACLQYLNAQSHQIPQVVRAMPIAFFGECLVPTLAARRCPRQAACPLAGILSGRPGDMLRLDRQERAVPHSG